MPQTHPTKTDSPYRDRLTLHRPQSTQQRQTTVSPYRDRPQTHPAETGSPYTDRPQSHPTETDHRHTLQRQITDSSYRDRPQTHPTETDHRLTPVPPRTGSHGEPGTGCGTCPPHSVVCRPTWCRHDHPTSLVLATAQRQLCLTWLQHDRLPHVALTHSGSASASESRTQTAADMSHTTVWLSVKFGMMSLPVDQLPTVSQCRSQTTAVLINTHRV